MEDADMVKTRWMTIMAQVVDIPTTSGNNFASSQYC